MYVKCKGNLMEVKYFVICTDLLLPLKANFSYFEIQIFMLLKLESESAMQKICHRIRNPNPPIFFAGLPSLILEPVGPTMHCRTRKFSDPSSGKRFMKNINQ